MIEEVDWESCLRKLFEMVNRIQGLLDDTYTSKFWKNSGITLFTILIAILRPRLGYWEMTFTIPDPSTRFSQLTQGLPPSNTLGRLLRSFATSATMPLHSSPSSHKSWLAYYCCRIWSSIVPRSMTRRMDFYNFESDEEWASCADCNLKLLWRLYRPTAAVLSACLLLLRILRGDCICNVPHHFKRGWRNGW